MKQNNTFCLFAWTLPNHVKILIDFYWYTFSRPQLQCTYYIISTFCKCIDREWIAGRYANWGTVLLLMSTPAKSRKLCYNKIAERNCTFMGNKVICLLFAFYIVLHDALIKVKLSVSFMTQLLAIYFAAIFTEH